MLLSAVSVLVVAQSSSEIPEGLMNNPVVTFLMLQHLIIIIIFIFLNTIIYGVSVIDHLCLCFFSRSDSSSLNTSVLLVLHSCFLRSNPLFDQLPLKPGRAYAG